MGKEWHKGGRSICSSKSKEKSNEASGCITALYHFFHSHHFYFPSRHHHHQPSIDSPSRNPKGLVAPRNSLDLTEESPLSTNYKLEKEILNIHVGGKKSTLRALLIDKSSSNCNSPRIKTPGPNVVARLMGLDLLPDNFDLNRSPRVGVRGHRLSGNGSGTRSLPVSPRISSDSDHRRLSLQLNIENTKHDEEFARKRLKELKQDGGSRSPRRSRKQIKQSTPTIRNFGMDITNLLENTRAGAAQNKIEYSRLSHKENTTSTNPTLVLRQDHISQKRPTKVTLKENLKGIKESELSPHPTPKTRNKQRTAFKNISTHVKSDSCDLLGKKKCKKISKSNDTSVNISVASSAFSVTERPLKQMHRDEEPERNTDATICSVQMYKYEKKLNQEPPRFNFYDSTTISATLTNPGGTVAEMKKLKEEEERVVAEIERHIVDALVHETVETMSFLDLNANAIRCVERRQDLLAAILKQRLRFNPNNVRFTSR
ncbi:PREDICTED: uncharacterized protein LOC104727759 [Camelina sativa]|uniref:Uncharacterized protein LOC104727759 n=1 Tax=Camelina sativa TaxID=90675 RepID=A0ABM0URQ9_CAMSA|nr:PREDICTED: uncharacterized protein LOC104727759 [Camelina sativa]